MRFVIDDFGSIAREALRLTAVGKASTNYKPVMREILVDMRRITAINFTSQGRRGGGSWARLKPRTIIRKGNSKILFTEGSNENYKKLKGSNILFKSLVEPDSAFGYGKAFNKSVRYGTFRPYASVHQHGGGNKVPARPFLRFLPSDELRWSEMIGNHVVKPHRVK